MANIINQGGRCHGKSNLYQTRLEFMIKRDELLRLEREQNKKKLAGITICKPKQYNAKQIRKRKVEALRMISRLLDTTAFSLVAGDAFYAKSICDKFDFDTIADVRRWAAS